MPGLLRMMGRTAVIAGTATTVSNRVSRRQARKWGAEEQQAQPEPQQYAAPPPPPAPAAPARDPIQELKDLADLKQQGILTDDEFAVQKAKILSA
jgi:hypothetical protein